MYMIKRITIERIFAYWSILTNLVWIQKGGFRFRDFEGSSIKIKNQIKSKETEWYLPEDH